MNFRSQLVCTWSATIFILLGLVGLILADYIPPISPARSAAEVSAVYAKNTLPIRFAVLMIMTGGAFVPGGLLTFFKTGPFAWDGLFVWWIPFVIFFAWYVLMFIVMVGVVKRQAST